MVDYVESPLEQIRAIFMPKPGPPPVPPGFNPVCDTLFATGYEIGPFVTVMEVDLLQAVIDGKPMSFGSGLVTLNPQSFFGSADNYAHVPEELPLYAGSNKIVLRAIGAKAVRLQISEGVSGFFVPQLPGQPPVMEQWNLAMWIHPFTNWFDESIWQTTTDAAGNTFIKTFLPKADTPPDQWSVVILPPGGVVSVDCTIDMVTRAEWDALLNAHYRDPTLPTYKTTVQVWFDAGNPVFGRARSGGLRDQPILTRFRPRHETHPRDWFPLSEPGATVRDYPPHLPLPDGPINWFIQGSGPPPEPVGPGPQIEDIATIVTPDCGS
jgi:hypothetical protein